MSWPFVLASGLAPGLSIMIYIFWKDRMNREPFHLLGLAFLTGMIAILPAIAMEMVFSRMFPGFANGNLFQIFIRAFIGVALMEEVAKMAALKYAVWKHRAFDEPFDGITYSVMVSMGFASLENVLYIWQANVTGGAYPTALLRAFTAVPAHATFAVMMGYFLGLARFDSHRSLLWQILALSTAVLFHGAYDFFLFTQEWTGTIAGAILSLLIGLYFSKRAIRLHDHAKTGWFPEE